MSSSLTMRVSREGIRAAAPVGVPTPVKDVVQFSDGSGPPRVVAYVERELPPGGIPAYLAARGSGARSFVLWADEHRRERVATLSTPSATGGVATFQVLGAHGELIGTFVREKALRGRGLRTRWTVTQAGGPEAVGFKGRIFWWWVWWLLLPLQVLILVFALFDSSPGNEGVARGPRRIVWRAGGQIPLEFRSKDDKLHVHAPELDWRLGASLVVLLRAFGPNSWDTRKK
ncbi:hypothetical protein [Streptomyces capitiformicae]|uniref:Uncharacterized protein n=1 Tax=Streptomyces capitiformicae TaxID=2014920 RepID=A0A918ZHR2_9ACTN|nr:hypothetical protein [Streptomyces capitiformicae]GHE53510.1 hypothetical protein GCM10017771_75930 [Streptomyces capitiformicae]